MNRLLMLLTGLLVSSATLASNCLRPNTQLELNNYPIQDQDGLNLSHAAASAILLQEQHKRERPISYHGLAMTGYLSKTPTTALLSEQRSPGEVLNLEGGKICDIVDAAAEFGVCDGNRSPLDHHGVGDAWTRQFHTLENYSKFLDYLDSAPRDLAAVRTRLVNAFSRRHEMCAEKDFAKFLIAGMRDELGQRLIDEEISDRNLIQQLQQEVTQGGAAGQRAARRLRNAEVRLRAMDALKRHAFEEVRDPRRPSCRKLMLKSSILRSMTADLQKKAADTLFQYRNPRTPEDHYRFSNNRSFTGDAPAFHALGEALKAGLSLPGPEISFLKNDFASGDLYDSLFRRFLSCSQGHDDSVFTEVMRDEARTNKCGDGIDASPMQARAIADVDRIMQQLSLSAGETRQRRVQELIGLTMPDCVGQMRASAQSKKPKCVSTVLNGQHVSKRDHEVDISALGQEEKNRRAIGEAVRRICEQRKPTSVEVCPEFLAHTEYQSTRNCAARNQFGLKFLPPLQAMTIVGYHVDPKGAISFLVQQPWGALCPWTDYYIQQSKEGTCQVDSAGRETGRFWVKAEYLIQNSTSLVHLQE